MEHIEFGEIRNLKFRDQEIGNIAYSPNGEYFVVDLFDETVIFRILDMQRNQLEEIKRIPGYFLHWVELGGTVVVTLKEEQMEEEEENEKKKKMRKKKKMMNKS